MKKLIAVAAIALALGGCVIFAHPRYGDRAYWDARHARPVEQPRYYH
ncbi:MAG: hypothetical protein M0Z80_08155 [Treponema sp.]|nr:hypothetical protein [Treponema sp.]